MNSPHRVERLLQPHQLLSRILPNHLQAIKHFHELRTVNVVQSEGGDGEVRYVPPRSPGEQRQFLILAEHVYLNCAFHKLHSCHFEKQDPGEPPHLQAIGFNGVKGNEAQRLAKAEEAVERSCVLHRHRITHKDEMLDCI